VLLVKEPGDVPASGAVVHYHDIGEYLTRREKLDILADALPTGDEGTPAIDDLDWTLIQPNEHGDWINQRSESFAANLPVAPGGGPSIFSLLTHGLKTNRDAWNYNSSRQALESNVARMIEFYNSQVDRFHAAHQALPGSLKARTGVAEKFVDRDPTKFSWEGGNFVDVARGARYDDRDVLVGTAIYRPFHRRWTNAGPRLNNRVYRLPRVYPAADSDNLVIGVLDTGSPAPFTVLCAARQPDDKLVGAGNAMQFLPQYVYDVDAPGDGEQDDLFAGRVMDGLGRRHNVTDHALAVYRALDPAIGRDDIFFYVYGILHSRDYRSAFAADLRKSLPRIPQVAVAEDFWAFSKAGCELAHLHTEYESVQPWPDLTYTYATGFDPQHADAYRVLKMKHPKVTDPHDPNGAKVNDRSRIIYNDWITIGTIPKRAYGYELGSRSAIAWVMESNRVRTDNASGIRNDPNDWAIEHDDPTYILDLVGRIVTVSMRTLDIVDSLPNLDL
jgi:predicted helicase